MQSLSHPAPIDRSIDNPMVFSIRGSLPKLDVLSLQPPQNPAVWISIFPRCSISQCKISFAIGAACFQHRASYPNGAHKRLPPKVQRGGRLRGKLHPFGAGSGTSECPAPIIHILEDQGSCIGSALGIDSGESHRQWLRHRRFKRSLEPFIKESHRVSGKRRLVKGGACARECGDRPQLCGGVARHDTRMPRFTPVRPSAPHRKSPSPQRFRRA